MKKVALFMNHYKFGGAEKSGIEQSNLLESDQVDVFVPNTWEENLETDYYQLVNQNFNRQFIYTMPVFFSTASKTGRTKYLKLLASILSGAFKNKHFKFTEYDYLWFNGLKVFILFTPLLILKRYHGKVLFHIRDYMVASRILTLAFKLLEKFNISLELISNSQSVKNKLENDLKVLPKTHICYNYCKVTNRKESRITGNIGVCSMLAPWKGVHQTLLFAKMYEAELKDLGVKKLLVFGDMIYKSNGEHSNYKEELIELTKKLQVNNVQFMGSIPFSEIVNQVDLLLHTSIEPEPFGRVIMEAYGAELPLISTGLGGASEILIPESPLRFQKYHLTDLYNKIAAVYTNDKFRADIIQAQKELLVQNNWKATNSFRNIFK